MLDMGFIHDIRKIVAEAAEQAPDAVLLGHHADRDRRARRRSMLHDPGPRRGDARSPRPSSASSQRVILVDDAAQAARCWPSCSPTASRSTARWSSPAPSTAPTGRASICEAPASAPPPSTATSARASASARSPSSSAGEIRVLVATDIAARGIDVDGITPRRQLRPARTCRRPTCTASAAPRAPAPTASRSRFAAARSAPTCATSKS